MPVIKKLLVITSILGLFILGWFVVDYIQAQPVSTNDTYITSNRCNSCHMGEHYEWHNSMHSKMMRKVSDKGVVVADFESDEMTFAADEAVWAIGSKWEQQFMAEVDGHEVLLPGAWLNSKQKWKNEGWDGWAFPDPVKRCHGCHTVGLNVETGKFVEPSIGCESCHGPGDWHSVTMGIGKIATGLDAQICGQCHTRGNSKEGGLFFPDGYRPGDNLLDYFDEVEPYPAQNTSQWWRNGHPRKRHQQYYAWRQGGHSNSLKNLKENYDGRYGVVTSKCLSCHAGEAVVDGMSEEYSLDEVNSDITCAVCHLSHVDVDPPRVDCLDCHKDGAYYHQPEKNNGHVACPEEAEVGCVGCHMPKTVMNGGDYTLHSHRAGVITPHETKEIGVPNSCASGCHTDKTLEWKIDAYEKFYFQ